MFDSQCSWMNISRTSTRMPTISTNQPNPFFSELPDILSDKAVPMKMPPTAMAVKLNSKVQLMVYWAMVLKKPKSELKVMMVRDDPTAVFMGSLPNSTNAGMMRKPPPAPNSPVTMPTAAPCRKRGRIFRG